MRNSASRQAMEWLAAAAKDPRACKREWEYGEHGTVVLASGRFWDVLSVPEELGLLTLDTLLRTPQYEPGPTLVDFAAHRVGFFLPPDPACRWIGSGIRYAGKGSWIAVPPPYRSGRSLQWLVPPDGSGDLHTPAALELALRQATGQLAVIVSRERADPGSQSGDSLAEDSRAQGLRPQGLRPQGLRPQG